MIKEHRQLGRRRQKYFEPCYRQGMCFPIKNKYLLC